MAEPMPNLKDNVIDKAENGATHVVDETEGAANAALDSLTDKVAIAIRLSMCHVRFAD